MNKSLVCDKGVENKKSRTYIEYSIIIGILGVIIVFGVLSYVSFIIVLTAIFKQNGSMDDLFKYFIWAGIYSAATGIFIFSFCIKIFRYMTK